MPAGYVVLFKPRRGVPWVELGRAATLREAVDLIKGKGMFWLHAVTADSVTGSDGRVAQGHGGDDDGADRGDDGRVHGGIRSVGLMPKNAKRGKACATIEGTT
ncbi:MAG: hypothetical protein C0467_31900 [Planctomycetaceae bacterium]|nr:hypothetical protein [Planctomycetaceae bacterium]